MKNFLATFAMTLILTYIFLFFGGALILENFWAMFVFIAFIIAILVTVLINLAIEIEELEGQVILLENKIEAGLQ
ncbi:MAG TPA: hypothetical protein VFD02_00285 [Syntrophomonadaceae bacterium]|nr:hypothetical protein [Syntrophomonadaceae bacterium]